MMAAAASHDEIATVCSPKLLSALQTADKQGRMLTATNEYDAAAGRVLRIKAAHLNPQK